MLRLLAAHTLRHKDFACQPLSLASQFSSVLHRDISQGNPTAPPAFVFDIDGVLTRGKEVLEPAKRAFEKLVTGGRWRFPVCFLTNGGGVTEAQKAEQLSEWLQVPAKEDQVILSHTPMQSLVPRLKDEPVLICGRGDVVPVAKHYGFSRVLSVHDLANFQPDSVPFVKMPVGQQDQGCPVRDHGLGSEGHPIKAVLVFTDPSNWYVDLQIILDVVRSGGVPLRPDPGPDPSPVELYFSNPDLLWANNFPRNRLGQGAFAHVVLSMFRELSDKKELNFPVKWFGKPNPEPYQLAGLSLVRQGLDLGLFSEPGPSTLMHAFSGIYSVGDNPAADVRGANNAGPPFISVLVKTGVFRGPGNNCPRDPAAISVPDVLGAVEAALHHTRSLRFHSMR